MTEDGANRIRLSHQGAPLIDPIDVFDQDGTVIATLQPREPPKTDTGRWQLEKSRAEWKKLGLDFPRVRGNPNVAFEEWDENGQGIHCNRLHPEERPKPEPRYRVLPVVSIEKEDRS